MTDRWTSRDRLARVPTLTHPALLTTTRGRSTALAVAAQNRKHCRGLASSARQTAARIFRTHGTSITNPVSIIDPAFGVADDDCCPRSGYSTPAPLAVSNPLSVTQASPASLRG